MKLTFFVAASLTIFLLAAPAFAFSTEPGPVDSSGSQLIDPDEALEGLADQSESGGGTTAVHFGDESMSVWVTGSSPAQR
jgi:hypothetical protein